MGVPLVFGKAGVFSEPECLCRTVLHSGSFPLREVPADLWKLPGLQQVAIVRAEAELGGAMLPSGDAVRQATDLRYLELHQNGLRGEISESMFRLDGERGHRANRTGLWSLATLCLEYNKLSGR